jgi:hypothetical protein
MRKICMISILLSIIISSGCSQKQANRPITSSVQTQSNAEGQQPNIVSSIESISDCSKIVIPQHIEINTNLIKEKELLEIFWFDQIKGKDVKFIIHYSDKGCSESVNKLINHVLNFAMPANDDLVTKINPATIPTTPPSSSPISSPIITEAKKEDGSVRAIGTHPDGRLLVRPATTASVSALGTPSCYGLETDLSWTGDYEAVWESKKDGSSSKVMTFPIDFNIIQPNDVPVEMQKLTLGETEILAYVPRYTDCHALETYLFGVSEGKGFPITFEMNPELIWTNIGQLPHHPFRVSNSELILTGGYGAGQDFIHVYHFRYDSKKRSMILQNTDQVNPSDIGG